MTLSVKYKVNVVVEGEFEMADDVTHNIAAIVAAQVRGRLGKDPLTPDQIRIESMTIVQYSNAGVVD